MKSYHVRLAPEDEKMLPVLNCLKMGSNDLTPAAILGIDRSAFARRRGIGRKKLADFDRLQAYAGGAAAQIADGRAEVAIEDIDSVLSIDDWDLTESELVAVDRWLAADLDRFLARHNDERKRQVLVASFGLRGQPARSLKQIGDELGLGREHVRQIESDVLDLFALTTRVTPSFIRRRPTPVITRDIRNSLASFIARFSSPLKAIDFLREIAKRGPAYDPAGMDSLVVRDIPITLLNDFWSNNPSPQQQPVVEDAVRDALKLSPAAGDYAINELVQGGVLVREDGGFRPGRVSKQALVSHVLIHFSRGLHWKEVAHLANSERFGQTDEPVREDRADPALYNAPNVTAMRAGLYKHVAHLCLREVPMKDLLTAAAQALEAFPEKRAALSDLRRQSDLLSKLPYDTVRHVCSEYGDEFNLSFDGKSQVDTIWLGQTDASTMMRLGLQRRLDECVQRESPMSKQAIADKLQLSLKRVDGLLHAAENVWSISETDAAHTSWISRSLDKDRVRAILDRLFTSGPRLAHASAVADQLDERLPPHYRLVSAFCSIMADTLRVNARGTLVAPRGAEIPYESLRSVAAACWEKAPDLAAARESLDRLVRARPSKAMAALYNSRPRGAQLFGS